MGFQTEVLSCQLQFNTHQGISTTLGLGKLANDRHAVKCSAGRWPTAEQLTVFSITDFSYRSFRKSKKKKKRQSNID